VTSVNYRTGIIAVAGLVESIAAADWENVKAEQRLAFGSGSGRGHQAVRSGSWYFHSTALAVLEIETGLELWAEVE
jgi:hypothetical protein